MSIWASLGLPDGTLHRVPHRCHYCMAVGGEHADRCIDSDLILDAETHSVDVATTWHDGIRFSVWTDDRQDGEPGDDVEVVLTVEEAERLAEDLMRAASMARHNRRRSTT